MLISSSSFRRAGLATAFALLCGAAPCATAHEGLMHVGRTTAGALTITEFDFDDLFTLPPATSPLLGWAGDVPTFRSLDGPDPGAGIFPLDAGAKVSVEAILFAPALQVWNHDLSQSISGPGEQLSLGPASLTEPVIWHINSADPAFDPSAHGWTATFRLIDSGSTAYAASEDYTLRFTVPAPAGLAPLSLAMGFLTRRRR